MSETQVFYRKWRPALFQDIVGQNHISHTLRKAIISNRIAHAYLFTGPRGVGKTSMARIVAKALNSPTTETGEPVSDSDTTQSIEMGNYLDLIEIDGASNRGIDDIRTLRDSTQFKPALGQYKIYIIDEVHMLTTPAFNALLKTLEEPPEKVVFILCTTDSYRVPSTIISRCQRFDFRRLSTNDIVGRLVEICKAEQINCELSALELIAKQAWGSLRDAENLLEQLSISYSNGSGTTENPEITEFQARELLGIGDRSVAETFTSFLLTSDIKSALELINLETEKGSNLTVLHNSVIDVLRSCLLVNAGITTENKENFDLEPKLIELIKQIPTSRLFQIISTMANVKINSDTSSPLPLELAVMSTSSENFSQRPKQTVIKPQSQKSNNGETSVNNIKRDTIKSQSQKSNNGETSVNNKIPQNLVQDDPPQDGPAKNSEETSEKVNVELWEKVIWLMRRTRNKKYTVGSLLRNTEEPIIENGKISLRFKSKSLSELFKEEMGDPRSKNALREAIEQVYNQSLELELRIQGNFDSDGNLVKDQEKHIPMVRQALQLGAKIIGEEKISTEK
ncbi:MAG: DNA polymerase III subunit gamma/tau [Dehalococcoidia bacterium]|jgi:DNA polymerase-3 subunit gamma/tau|nr:DNA polymerase III subunit gamma/tau [Dehalococcoidia bacterium]MDP7231272.1 DNA polymerase III subunit gamma/tau [Dehalococcoidia bacterium]MDP7613420.1 DNA polymerase III subunit gamma/tau [Dehalococcoidia bacterium]|tara:strand:+ start:1128 stop:2828 length:1701 start_codon:yes stop_codon:yes gene_type:complete